MELSVVIACTDAGRSITECVRRLKTACAGVAAELLVVDASADDTAAQAAAFEGVRVVQLPYGTLTPHLWAEGYRRASGRVIAFTTGHCLAAPTWTTAMLDALEDGAAGAGGPLVLARSAGALDAAVYYLRYSAFTPRTLGAGRLAGEIAGDNAAYARDGLDRHADSLADGFWELDFHRLLRADGGWLAGVPAAGMEFGRSFPAGTIVRHRFAHGMHFGAGRVKGGRRTAWQMVLSAPLVPAVLAIRTGRRVVYDAGSAGQFVRALPWLLVLASAWAAGEAWGALHGAPMDDPRRRSRESDSRAV
jgi:hypothetical protein